MPQPHTHRATAAYTPPRSLDDIPSAPRVAPTWIVAFLAGAFVLSGAAGLIYESIWTRYLSLFVGHSAYAQVIVLVIFLGGMSLGAVVTGRYSPALRFPLAWYAAVEFAVGLIGFFFHDAYVWLTAHAYTAWFPALAGGAMLPIAKWSLAGGMLLPQSILLGATFPLMTAGVARLRPERTGDTLGLFYFANSIGASVGVLVAGFVLLRAFGLPGTLLAAALLNFVVAFAVGALVRFHGATDGVAIASADASRGRRDPMNDGTARTLWRLLLVVSAGTALSSFIYEIGWIRALSLVLGSATHSFELMLSAFILGLAIGALWIRGRADALTQPVRTLAAVQWTMGMLAIATLPIYAHSFEFTAALLQTLQRTDAGYHAFTLARYAMCLAVMLPATICAGMTLPLITHVLMKHGGERAIGVVYGVNTFGSIVGAGVAALVLMPLLGLKALLIVGGATDLVIGFVLFVHVHRGVRALPSRLTGLMTLSVVVIALLAALSPFDKVVLSSGVFRHGIISTDAEFKVPFYEDGRTATVSVRTNDSTISLATNGKPDASLDPRLLAPLAPGARRQSLRTDLATQVLLPVITLAHNPFAKTAVVIGEGSGMTSHFLLASPTLTALYTVEIEPAMIRGSRAFYPANRRVFDDARSHFVIDDAKSFFAANPRTYDVILSEPSNPWVSGVSGLFTREFYQRVSQQLAPGGVFGQWLHTYEIEDGLALSVLRAIDQTFADYQLFFTSSADILIVATNSPRLAHPDWSIAALPGVVSSLPQMAPLTSDGLEALRIASRTSLHAHLAATADSVNSDFHPILDLGAERARYLRENAIEIESLAHGRFELPAALEGRRVAPPEVAQTPVGGVARPEAAAVATSLRALWNGRPAAMDTTTEPLRTTLFQMRRFQRDIRGDAAPNDWALWTAGMVEMETDLHAGAAGVADEPWFAQVRGYMQRAHAPADAMAALAFTHGVAAWNWSEVDSAAPLLLADARAHRALVPLDELREATIFSRLALGDPAGARQDFKVFAALSPDHVAHLRDRLLAATLLQEEAAQARRQRPGR